MFQILRSCRYEHIEKFVIYGERHSGTKFLHESLSCYNIVSTGYFGHKHFFGFTTKEKIEFSMHTMFCCIVRNPYQWIAAFHNLRHHVPKINKEYKNFVTNEWFSVDQNGQEIIKDRNFLTKQRYKNIFELRKCKNTYMFETLPTLARNYVFITYEDFIQNHINIMRLIQDRFCLKQEKELPIAHPQSIRTIPSDIKHIIDINTTWELENKIGYFQL